LPYPIRPGGLDRVFFPNQDLAAPGSQHPACHALSLDQQVQFECPYLTCLNFFKNTASKLSDAGTAIQQQFHMVLSKIVQPIVTTITLPLDSIQNLS
jgi:hypothetical protein